MELSTAKQIHEELRVRFEPYGLEAHHSNHSATLHPECTVCFSPGHFCDATEMLGINWGPFPATFECLFERNTCAYGLSAASRNHSI